MPIFCAKSIWRDGRPIHQHSINGNSSTVSPITPSSSFDPGIFRPYPLSPSTHTPSKPGINILEGHATQFVSEGTGVIYIVKRKDDVEGTWFIITSPSLLTNFNRWHASYFLIDSYTSSHVTVLASYCTLRVRLKLTFCTTCAFHVPVLAQGPSFFETQEGPC